MHTPGWYSGPSWPTSTHLRPTCPQPLLQSLQLSQAISESPILKRERVRCNPKAPDPASCWQRVLQKTSSSHSDCASACPLFWRLRWVGCAAAICLTPHGALCLLPGCTHSGAHDLHPAPAQMPQCPPPTSSAVAATSCAPQQSAPFTIFIFKKTESGSRPGLCTQQHRMKSTSAVHVKT